MNAEVAEVSGIAEVPGVAEITDAAANAGLCGVFRSGDAGEAARFVGKVLVFREVAVIAEIAEVAEGAMLG